MSGVVCVIIMDGNKAQGAGHDLISSVQASCTLADYLVTYAKLDRTYIKPADLQPIADFHGRAITTLQSLKEEIDRLNSELASKYPDLGH